MVLTEHGKRVDQPHLTELAFLVIREALTNVMRHAVSATRAVVSLTFEAECLKITVHDNGKQVTSPCKAGTGLTAMSKRIRDAGGDVTTTSTSNGWKLTARIPYQS
ncbi:sensor histidine kinase [Corynebacterium camporealensis]